MNITIRKRRDAGAHSGTRGELALERDRGPDEISPGVDKPTQASCENAVIRPGNRPLGDIDLSHWGS